MRISDAGLDLIKFYEGYKDEAYSCPAGVITIGYGTTRYPNRYKIQLGDKCTRAEAEEWLINDVSKAEKVINNSFKGLTQSQFDALVSFQYNTGAIGLIDCTLAKKARVNPNDPTIYTYDEADPVDSCEFLRWVRGKGKVMNGLIKRRMAEADLYKT